MSHQTLAASPKACFVVILSEAYDTSPFACNLSTRTQTCFSHEGPGPAQFVASARAGGREKAWLAVSLRADSNASPEISSYSASNLLQHPSVLPHTRSSAAQRSSG